MSVDIEPFELSFRRPFTTEVSQTLTIKNPNTVPVAFKVKTTAPKQYCVRPNAGRIEAGQDFDVTVLLQAMKQEPPSDARCRDKFLVQSAPITSDKEFASIATVLDTTEKGQLQERKIRVNWLEANPELDQGPSRPMAATPTKQTIVNGANDTPDVARTYSSPGATDDTAPSSSAPPPYHSEDSFHGSNEKVEEKADAPAPGPITQATTAVTSAAQYTYEEIKAKLTQAEAQIASLTENGLRQRNVKTTAADNDRRPVAKTAQAVKQTVEGVPVQVAAIMCVVSFLLAYFFF
ncbi:hypothetical protein G7046_g9841 [Stylonectria norvegica]|nr:hypothetical protein G7046_g9841 [Stylonectria norvegica]